MKVVITKQMTVIGDNGGTVAFKPSTKKKPFVEVSNEVYRKLLKANAARPYLEVVANKDATKTTNAPEAEAEAEAEDLNDKYQQSTENTLLDESANK